ncbi:MAG: response regulator [Candidatus Stygibacter frigidus]|nr:response regulator [Candidatus Stygibacter frigidus]
MNNEPVKILVIDDDAEVLMLTSRILKSAGYEVLQTQSVSEGMELLKQQPEILLLDVVMPEMNGFDFCRKIKSQPEFSKIFIILLSGVKVTAEDQAAGLNLGADGYILRPFTKDELLAKINAYVRIHKELVKISKSENWLAITLKSIGNGIVVTDSRGNISYINPAMEKMVCLEQVDVIGRSADNILKFSEDDYQKGYENLISDVLENKPGLLRIDNAILGQYRDKPIYVELTITKIYSESECDGLVIIVQDISKRKIAEKELDQYRDNLEENVIKRTSELLKRNEELEHFHELSIEREKRVKVLRDQVKELEQELSKYRR